MGRAYAMLSRLSNKSHLGSLLKYRLLGPTREMIQVWVRYGDLYFDLGSQGILTLWQSREQYRVVKSLSSGQTWFRI